MLIFEPKIGDIVKVHPYVSLDKNGQTETEPIPGEIIYVNRPHRYFTARFIFPRGGFNESFKFVLPEDIA